MKIKGEFAQRDWLFGQNARTNGRGHRKFANEGMLDLTISNLLATLNEMMNVPAVPSPMIHTDNSSSSTLPLPLSEVMCPTAIGSGAWQMYAAATLYMMVG